MGTTTATVGGVDNVLVNFGGGTGVEDVKASLRAGSLIEISSLNAALKYKFYTDVTNWHINMMSGQSLPPERQLPPVPPMAWELAPPDKDGYEFPQIGTTPIAPVPEAVFYHGITIAQQNAAKPPNVFELGHATGNPGWWSVGFDDTMQIGFKKSFPGPDGNMITVQKVGFPFGNKYEQIA